MILRTTRVKDITWSYAGYSDNESGPFLKSTEYYLEFDGVDDYVRREASVFDSLEFPQKNTFERRTEFT